MQEKMREIILVSVCEMAVLCGKNIQLHSSKERGNRRKCVLIRECPYFRCIVLYIPIRNSFPPGHGEPQQAEDTSKCFSVYVCCQLHAAMLVYLHYLDF